MKTKASRFATPPPLTAVRKRWVSKLVPGSLVVVLRGDREDGQPRSVTQVQRGFDNRRRVEGRRLSTDGTVKPREKMYRYDYVHQVPTWVVAPTDEELRAWERGVIVGDLRVLLDGGKLSTLVLEHMLTLAKGDLT